MQEDDGIPVAGVSAGHISGAASETNESIARKCFFCYTVCNQISREDL